MAELFLKFEDRVLQELLLSGGAVTIGRQPDNVFRIDNPAVSGYHARIYSEADHYVIEDIESFNGTYVNGQRISKAVLKDGDNATIGKHTIEFRDEVRQIAPPYQSAHNAAGGQLPMPPQLDPTMVLDTAKAKQMLTQAAAAASSAGSVVVRRVGMPQSLPPVKTTFVHQTIGTLTIVKGRTDGALIRLSTPIDPGETEAGADQRLQGFLVTLTPSLKAYFPELSFALSTSPGL